jgi:hypothetical protein
MMTVMVAMAAPAFAKHNSHHDNYYQPKLQCGWYWSY